MEYNNGVYRPSGIAWAGLIVSIIALILAWTAFNRSGQNLTDTIREEVQEATQAIRQEFQQVQNGTTDDPQGNANDVSVDEDPDNVGE